MSKDRNSLKSHVAAEDPFASLFAKAEQSPRYWAELAKLEFTEKVIERMTELGLTRSALAARLQVQPGFVTRLLGGQNNFELATMTKIARALGCDFRCQLQPQEKKPTHLKILRGNGAARTKPSPRPRHAPAASGLQRRALAR